MTTITGTIMDMDTATATVMVTATVTATDILTRVEMKSKSLEWQLSTVALRRNPKLQQPKKNQRTSTLTLLTFMF